MQGLLVVGLIFEEISNINLNMSKSLEYKKYRSRSMGQGTCRVGISRRSIIQGLVVEGFIVEDIWKGNVKGAKVNGVRNIGQGHRVTVPAESIH